MHKFTEKEAKRFADLWAPARAWHSLKFVGLEKLDPAKPGILVLNHTRLGPDLFPFLTAIIDKKKIPIRMLAHRGFFSNPITKLLVSQCGFVNGTPENVRFLMSQNEFMAVCPGGIIEAFKGLEDDYKIIWGNRAGFVRLAIEFGYPIIPVASLGGEESYDIHLESEKMENSFLGKMMKQSWLGRQFLVDGKYFIPFASGFMFSPVPKPVPFTFQIGNPVETIQFKGQQENEELVQSLRKEVQDNIEQMLNELRVEQKSI